ILTRNRLGNDDGTLIHRRELCVPSLVDPVPSTTTTTSTTTSTSTSSTTRTSTTGTTPTSTSTTSTTSTTTTSTTIRVPVCGDGIVDTEVGETCDDGNTLAGDCCSTHCQ